MTKPTGALEPCRLSEAQLAVLAELRATTPPVPVDVSLALPPVESSERSDQ